jgi:AraC-like DNA-binding protein
MPDCFPVVRKSQDLPPRLPERAYASAMRPLFERQTILHSREYDKARAFLSTRSIELELAGRAGNASSFEVRYNGVYFPGLWLGYIRYGAAVTSRVLPERQDYWIQLPLHGRISSSLGVECNRSRGVISPPAEIHVLRSDAETERLSVCIHADALMRQLGALLDDVPQEPVRFSAAIDLEHGHGRALARVVRCAAVELERSGWFGDLRIASRFEDFVMTGLLLSQPNNYTRALRKHAQPIAPRDVRRAVEYLHENVAQPITLGDLVRECGVPGRTLLKHFQDFKGVSPMRYLRNLRLQQAREALQQGRVRQVNEAVSRWHFPHPGRFSIEYRRRFGESPSETLARAAAPDHT